MVWSLSKSLSSSDKAHGVWLQARQCRAVATEQGLAYAQKLVLWKYVARSFMSSSSLLFSRCLVKWSYISSQSARITEDLDCGYVMHLARMYDAR